MSGGRESRAYSKPVRSIRRGYRDAGVSALEAWRAIERNIESAARDGGWRPAQLAAALAEWREDVEAAYGIPAGELERLEELER